MIDPKIKELLNKYDFVVIPSRCVKSLWQTWQRKMVEC